jgi:hypothetical protein
MIFWPRESCSHQCVLVPNFMSTEIYRGLLVIYGAVFMTLSRPRPPKQCVRVLPPHFRSMSTLTWSVATGKDANGCSKLSIGMQYQKPVVSVQKRVLPRPLALMPIRRYGNRLTGPSSSCRRIHVSSRTSAEVIRSEYLAS